MSFVSRLPGTCVCGNAINAGDLIERNAMGKYVHAACLSVQSLRPVYRIAKDTVEEWAAAGLVRVAGLDPDHARELNGVGFSRYDGDFGHDMAEKILAENGLTDKMWAVVVKLATKYQRQIGPKPTLIAV